MSRPRSLHLTSRPRSLRFDTLFVQEQCPQPSNRSEETYDGLSFGFAANTHCFFLSWAGSQVIACDTRKPCFSRYDAGLFV